MTQRMRRPPDPAKLRTELLRALIEIRLDLGLSQTDVAARMGTSQSSLARIEAIDEVDPRVSTLERLAYAPNSQIQWKVVPRYGGGRPRATSP
ncbi:MAG: helix-turn-helix transcriptional regulator [Actinomycetota bacterium]